MHVSSGPSLTLCSGGTLLDPPYPLHPSFLPPLTVSLTQSRPDSSPRWCSDLVLQLVVVDHHGGGDPQHQALAVRETALGVSTSRRGRLCDSASHTAGEIDRWGDIHGRESSISKLLLLDIKLTATYILFYLSIRLNSTYFLPSLIPVTARVSLVTRVW